MEHCNYNYEDYRKNHPIQAKFPFTSSRKRMGTIFWDANNSCKVLLEKGASELVLEGCNKFHSFDGSIIPIDNFIQAEINKAIEGSFAFLLIFFYNKNHRNGFKCFENSGFRLQIYRRWRWFS